MEYEEFMGIFAELIKKEDKILVDREEYEKLKKHSRSWGEIQNWKQVISNEADTDTIIQSTKDSKEQSENRVAALAQQTEEQIQKNNFEALREVITVSVPQITAEKSHMTGRAKYYMGYNTEAIQDYKKALEKTQEMRKTIEAMRMQSKTPLIQEADTLDAEIHNDIGLAEMRLNLFPSAAVNFNNAVFLKQDFAEAYYNRGNLQYLLGNFKDAVSDYSRAIALKPDFELAYLSRSFAHDTLGKSNEAGTDWFHGSGIYSKSKRAHEKIAELLSKKKEIALVNTIKEAAEAIGVTEQEISELIEHDQLIKGDSFYIAEMDCLKNSILKHREIMQEIKKDDDRFQNLLQSAMHSNELGLSKLKAGKLEEAIIDFNDAINKNPYLGQAYKNRADVYTALGKKDLAKKDLTSYKDLAVD